MSLRCLRLRRSVARPNVTDAQRIGRLLVAVAAVTAPALLLSACTGNSGGAALPELYTPAFSYSSPPPPTPLPSTAPTALAILAQLPVKPPGPSTGFNPSVFGGVHRPPSISTPCDSVNYVYLRDLTQVQRDPTSCSVAAGALFDPYTATWVWYIRGKTAALNQVTLDHVVSLSDAWVTGASAWAQGELTGFYNDPLDLMATATTNVASKADKDAAGWLPANPQGRCIYAITQVAVKFKYQLWVTAAEKSALQKVLTSCPATVTRPKSTLPAPPEPTPTKPAKRKPAVKPRTPAKPAATTAKPAPKPTATAVSTVVTPTPTPTATPIPTPTLTLAATPTPTPTPSAAGQSGAIT